MDTDWSISHSDSELSSDYTPDPDKIVELYTLINKGKIPELITEIFPRSEPFSQTTATSPPSTNTVSKKNNNISEKSPEEPNEFDFDSQPVDTVKRFTPRRAPGKAQSKTVARMDKVCSNIIKYQKMDAEQMQNAEKAS